MFLHIGDNVTILEKDIITIIDRKTIDESEDTKEFIESMIEEGCLQGGNIDEKDIKAYIVTDDGIKTKIYVSNISTMTLYKRNKNIKKVLEVKISG